MPFTEKEKTAIAGIINEKFPGSGLSTLKNTIGDLKNRVRWLEKRNINTNDTISQNYVYTFQVEERVDQIEKEIEKVEQIMLQILQEVSKIGIQLSLITDNEITSKDVNV